MRGRWAGRNAHSSLHGWAGARRGCKHAPSARYVEFGERDQLRITLRRTGTGAETRPDAASPMTTEGTPYRAEADVSSDAVWMSRGVIANRRESRRSTGVPPQRQGSSDRRDFSVSVGTGSEPVPRVPILMRRSEQGSQDGGPFSGGTGSRTRHARSHAHARALARTNNTQQSPFARLEPTTQRAPTSGVRGLDWSSALASRSRGLPAVAAAESNRSWNVLAGRRAGRG